MNNQQVIPEVDNFMREVFMAELIGEKNYQDLVSQTFKTQGITWQDLEEQVQVGIDNGYTIEQQIKILKQML